MLSNTSLSSATLGPNQAVSKRANVSRGRHHTYCTEQRTDTTSCSGFTVTAKGQRGEEQGVCVERKCGTERHNEKVTKREKEKVKVGMAVQKRE